MNTVLTEPGHTVYALKTSKSASLKSSAYTTQTVVLYGCETWSLILRKIQTEGI
jgi:hypothetical protein